MPILQYDGKKFADLSEDEVSLLLNHKGMHINFNGNLLKMSKVEVLTGEEGENENILKLSIPQLEEIVGDFENMLKEHTEGIPATAQGQLKAVQEGKLPDCGEYFLRDRGITLWYLECGWLWTEKIEGQKRQWALTIKYISDGVGRKEEALNILREKREFKKEMESKALALKKKIKALALQKTI